MTRRAIIREQLRAGLPDAWIDEDLVEALELARGGRVLKHPEPDMADERHALALLRLAVRVEEGEC